MTAPLWTGPDLLASLDARMDGTAPTAVTGVSIDTRTLQPGDLFVAIKGDASDGHDYVAPAFEKGAAAAIIDRAHVAALVGKGALYVVDDTLRAMERLGRAARARTQARIVAVTGSVGKTGTKEALRLTLEAQGPTHASVASYNNHWGVPLTLSRMPKETLFGIFEIGMNHAGEITPLVAMVQPHVAVITTIAPVHVEHFPDGINGIARAKAEIFSGLVPAGVAVVSRDVAQFDVLRACAQAAKVGRLLTFGEAKEAEARLISCETSDAGSRVEADILGKRLHFRLAAPGRHLAMNALAVLLAVHELGADVEAAAAALGGFEAPVGRGQRVVLSIGGGSATLIDESYNANPTSMRAAFALLGAAQVAPGGKRIAALGDMLELGPEGPQMHRDLAGAIEANGIDLVFAAGPLMKNLFDALPSKLRGGWAEAAAGLEPVLRASLAQGDVVMIKGSNGSRMGPIVSQLKQDFAPPAGVAH
jgi:UDP-N-acetylmuramoyl-tripeptide--D-alanyl-D-alanine ligase